MTFREFKVGDLFTLTGLKQVKSQKNVVESDNGIPFVVQSTKNNMVKCHVDRQALLDGGENVYDGNTIVLGVTLPAVSYQELEFGASQVITARRDDLNPLRGLYLVTAMRKALLPKYSYTNKPGISKYKEDLIVLPVKPGTNEINYTEDDIDWDYMESYIHELEESYIHELDAYLKETGLDDYTLTDDEQALLESEPIFREFNVGELFDCNTTKAFYPTKENLPDGKTPYISRTTANNGVSGFYDDIHDKFTIHHQCITVGAETGIAFWQEKPFIPGVKVYTITHKQLNSKNALFITTLLNKSANNYGFTYLRTLKKIKAEIIQLPVKPGTDEVNYTEDDIDWDYMESYIRVMEKQVIADVVDYKESAIATAKELVYV